MNLELFDWSFFMRDNEVILTGDVYNFEGLGNGLRIESAKIVSLEIREDIAVAVSSLGWVYTITSDEVDFYKVQSSKLCCSHLKNLREWIAYVETKYKRILEIIAPCDSYSGTALTEEVLSNYEKNYIAPKRQQDSVVRELINNLQAGELLIVFEECMWYLAFYKDTSGVLQRLKFDIKREGDFAEYMFYKEVGSVEFRMYDSYVYIPFCWSENIEVVKLICLNTDFSLMIRDNIVLVGFDECKVLTKNDFYGEGMFSAEYIYGGVQV